MLRSLLIQDRRKHLTLAAASLGYGIVQLDVTIVNVAVASIGHSFGAQIVSLQWIVTTYKLAFAALILAAGSLGDRLGAKRVFACGFAVFTAASLACALAPSVPFLIGCRAVQGIGAAILVPNALSLLNHAYSDHRERAWAVAIWAAGASTALIAGPLVGGALIVTVGWRAIFLVNVPIGLAGIALVFSFTSETPKSSEGHLDLPGQFTGVIFLGSLCAAIIEGGQLGWTSPLVLATFAAAVLTILLFIGIEWRAERPMLPLSLFQRSAFSVSSAIGLMVNIAFYGLIFVLSLYFQELSYWSPIRTGLGFVPMLSAVLIANLLVPRITQKVGGRAMITLGTAIMGGACVWLLKVDAATTYLHLVGQFVALGAGLGLLVPPLTSMLLGSVDKSQSGIASGVLNAMRQLGSVLGVALFGAMISAHRLLAGLRISLVISIMLLFASSALVIVSRKNGRLPRS